MSREGPPSPLPVRVELVLVRHGRAARPPATRDDERPLTEEGLRQCEAIGRALARLRSSWHLVATSPARRCRETAELLGLGEPVVERSLGLAARIEDAIALVRDLPETAVLVGHEPILSGLAAALLDEGDPVPALPTGGIVGLSRRRPGGWRLRLVADPGSLAALCPPPPA